MTKKVEKIVEKVKKLVKPASKLGQAEQPAQTVAKKACSPGVAALREKNNREQNIV